MLKAPRLLTVTWVKGQTCIKVCGAEEYMDMCLDVLLKKDGYQEWNRLHNAKTSFMERWLPQNVYAKMLTMLNQ